MQQVMANLSLPEGIFYSKVMIFDGSDVARLRAIYANWRNLCNLLGEIGARKINLPE